MIPLVLKNIILKYYEQTALNIKKLQVSCSLGILGCGGAGKSSLLKVIAGLEEIEQGEIFIHGKEVGAVKIRDRNISLISSKTPLFENKTVYKNLVYPLKKRKINKKGQLAAIEEIKKILPKELKDSLNKKVKDLSLKGRAALFVFRALIKRPAIILVDEPCTFLPDDSLELTAYFLKILKASKVFFVIASYDFNVLSAAVDSFVVLRRGEVIFSGDLEQIKATEDKYIRALAGLKLNITD